MTRTSPQHSDTFNPQLPSLHEESHPARFAQEWLAGNRFAAQALYTDFEDPADRLTMCEVARGRC